MQVEEEKWKGSFDKETGLGDWADIFNRINDVVYNLTGHPWYRLLCVYEGLA